MTVTDTAAGRAPRDIELSAVIDARPLGGFQIRVALLCTLALLLDAFDSTSIGFVAPRLTAVWHLPPGALGPVFAWGFFGQLLGAVIAGPVADRLGRRGVLIAGLIEFGLGALATTRAYSLESLLVLRVVTGLGLGAAAPNAIALVTEISPAARRSFMLAVALCGMTVGAATAGLVAARLLPQYGWTSVFAAGGILPLALAPLLVMWLPESPHFLALAGNRDAAIFAMLRKINPTVPATGHFVVAETRATGLSIQHLFRDGRSLTTILLWIVVFMNNFLIYVFASWLPSLARASGLTEQASVLTGVDMNVGGFAGTIAMGWLLGRFPIERLMGINYVMAAAFIGLLALVAGHGTPMGLFAAAAGFCIVGGQTGANALLAYRHPTSLRATALSFGLAIGRVASIVGPLGAGWVISVGWSTRSTFLLAVIPSLCASMAVLCLGRHHASQRVAASELDLGTESVGAAVNVK
jgi:MFS transporter, AAHS family, 4-hydroxybenzoate transporter